MFKYSKYLLSSIARKKAPYLIIFCFLAIFDWTTWLQINEMNKIFSPMINSMSTFNKFFPFLFSTFFASMIVIYTFKQGEEDGSELMVVAKPLSRIHIILGKFLVVFIYLFAFTVITFINYFGLSFSDEYVSNTERVQYAASLSFGGGVVLIIIASILIIFAAFFKKTALLSIGITVSSIVPIISFILSPIGKGQAFSYSFNDNPRQQINLSQLDKLLKPGQTTNDITGQDIQNIVSPDSLYIGVDKEQFKDYDKYSDDIWYDNASYGDLWYQWGRFYSIFQSQKTSSSSLAHWTKNVVQVKADESNTITLANNERYVLFLNRSGLTFLPNAIKNVSKMIETIIEPANITKWNDLSLYDRMYVMESWITKLKSQESSVNNQQILFEKSKENSSFFNHGKVSDTATFAYAAVEHILKNYPNAKPAPSAYPSFVTIGKGDGKTYDQRVDVISDLKSIPVNKPLLLDTSNFAKVESYIYVFNTEDFIATNYTLIAWSAFAFLFLVLSIALFIKRDFR